jgi:IS1 family transposase
MKWAVFFFQERRLTSNGFAWIATDAATRQVIAFHVGDRSRTSTRKDSERFLSNMLV